MCILYIQGEFQISNSNYLRISLRFIPMGLHSCLVPDKYCRARIMILTFTGNCVLHQRLSNCTND